MQLECIGKLAARALTIGRIVALELVGAWRRRADHWRVLRTTRITVGYPGSGSKAGCTDNSSPLVSGGIANRWCAIFLEDQLIAVERCRIGKVKLELIGRRETP